MTDTRFGRRDPNARGYYGEYGGKFVPETLVAPVEELQQAYFEARQDAAFLRSSIACSRTTSAGPRRSTKRRGSRASLPRPAARIFLKREDLAHTGAHKINNALGQALLAKRMGKKRVIAETGAGQHGVATATVCALLGLECHVYMGTDDMARQALNVVRMRLLGATVRGVSAGSRTLKDAINEAMRDWVTNVTDSYYLLGSVLGPHPYPLMVREFQSVIGREAREQFQAMNGRLPDAVVACVGGGSNALGIFDAFIPDRVRAADRRRGRRRSAGGRPARRALCDRARRRAAGHAHLRAAGRERQHRADALDLRGPRLCRRRARTRVAAETWGAPSTRGSATTTRSPRFSSSRGWKASSRRSSRRTPWPMRARSRRSSGRGAQMLVNLSGPGRQGCRQRVAAHRAMKAGTEVGV